jgi:hypothetical protein
MPDKEWTIMVYLAGNNNLVEEMVFALREIYRVGSRDDFDIIIQFDTGGPPRRFRVSENPDTLPAEGKELDRVAEAVLKEKTPKGKKEVVRQFLAEILKVSQAREDQDLEKAGVPIRKKRDLRPTKEILQDFLTYCLYGSKEEGFYGSKAENYMLILSGHGSGAVGDFLGGNNPTSRLSIRDLPEVFKSFTEQLKDVNGKSKIDVLGMDSCLMSMAEVAYEVHKYVDFMVGAEGFERNSGWPYARLLELLMASKQPLSLPADQMAEAIVRDYTEYYENYTLADLSTDLSAVNLAKLREKVIPNLRRLARKMKEKIEEHKKPSPNPVRDAILLSHWEAQSYKDEQYTDLWDFCDLLAHRCAVYKNGKITGDGIAPDLARECEEVRDAIYVEQSDQGAVTLSAYCGAAFQFSHGLSVFFPWADMKDAEGTSDLDAYKKLKFASEEAADWHGFLKTYLAETQRLPRGEGVKSRRLRKISRLNERAGIFTTLALKENAPADRENAPADRENAPADRENAPADRENAPADRFLALADKPKIGCMKNPAVDWYPCDFILAEQVGQRKLNDRGKY